jgi:hypothetical protein
MAKKENYLGSRLSDDHFYFLKEKFGRNLSEGIAKSIETFKNMIMLAQVEIRKQQFTKEELHALIMVKSLKTIDKDTLGMVAIQHGADAEKFISKMDNLGSMVKYMMFEILDMYDLDELIKKFGITDQK